METEVFDRTNAEQQAAYDMIEKTSNSFFLAGRAGTGKTTFLKRIQEESRKSFIVLAPTGVAAINAGGQTIHSFFGFDLGVLTPGYIGAMNENKIRAVRHIDGIIIDEVSMVRCDIMDAIDRTLRHYRKSYAPFGGLQMVFVGDMFQLEPIATGQDREILKDFYPGGSYYFYKSMVIERMELPKIEFQKIYRQSDPRFIELLEHLRLGQFTHSDMARINTRVVPEWERNSNCVTLTSRREEARAINGQKLAAIESPEFAFDVMVQGDCRRLSEIVEEHLVLKVGAQVMFTKNDRDGRWVNGTVCRVSGLGDTTVKVKMEEGEEYSIDRETWDFTDYEYDKETKSCKKNVVGRASQYPLRLAWAITIHKSQSLTFSHVAVDFGKRAFSNGQAYVALSRARSFEGLELVRPMTYDSVLVSRDVLKFAQQFNDTKIITRELSIGSAIESSLREQDFDGIAVKLFDMSREAASRGDSELSRELMSRCMSFVVDDACLSGQTWSPVVAVSPDALLLNATGFYYSGQRDKAEKILEKLGGEKMNDVTGLYLLARCMEDRQDWKAAERAYDSLIVLHNKDIDMGMQSPVFRKVIYRVAVLNETVYHQKGAHLLQQLMGECLTYIPYNTALRRIRLESLDMDLFEERDPADDDAEPKLRELFEDRSVSEDEFIEVLRRRKAERSPDLDDYRKFIREMDFDEPRD